MKRFLSLLCAASIVFTSCFADTLPTYADEISIQQDFSGNNQIAESVSGDDAGENEDKNAVGNAADENKENENETLKPADDDGANQQEISGENNAEGESGEKEEESAGESEAEKESEAGDESLLETLADLVTEKLSLGASVASLPEKTAVENIATDSDAQLPDDLLQLVLEDATPSNATETSSDLTDFVTAVKMTDENGVEIISDDTVTVYEGDTYHFLISFAESNDVDDRRQFEADSDGYLTYELEAPYLKIEEYTIPQAITNSKGVVIGNYTITRNDSGNYEIRAAFLNVDDNGKETELPYYDNSSLTQFRLLLNAEVDSDGSDGDFTVYFNDKIRIDVTVSKDSGLKAEKTGTYQSWANWVYYTYTVTGTAGTVNNVVSVDKLGDFLSLNSGKGITVYELDGKTERSDITAVYDETEKTITTSGISLSNGEGYVVAYYADVDFNKYIADNNIKNASVSFNVNNTVTVKGDDLNGGHPEQTVSTDTKVSRTAISKAGNVIPLKNSEGTPAYYTDAGHTGIVFGGDDTSRPVYIIEWTVTYGDGQNWIDDVVLTDAYGGHGLTLYKEKPLEVSFTGYTDKTSWQGKKTAEIAWDGGAVSYGSTEITTGKETGTYDTFSVQLPGSLPEGFSQYNAKQYVLTYYTLYEGTKNFYNYAYTDAESHSDLVEAGVSAGGATAGVVKEVANVDSDYIYYRITMSIPAGCQDKYFYLRDSLTDGQNYDSSQFEDFRIIRTTESGETTEITPYEGEYQNGTSETLKQGTYYKHDDTVYKSGFFIYFNCDGFWARGTSHTLPWGISEASTVTVTYKVSKNSVNNTGSTIHQILTSKAIKNTVSLNYDSTSVSDAVYYSELENITKHGEQNGSSLTYSVLFNNTVSGKAQSTDGTIVTSNAVLPTTFSGAYLEDTFDSRLTLKPLTYGSASYGVIALAYPRGTNMDSPASWQARAVKEFVCPAEKVDITGNTMKAYWSDFTKLDDSAVTLEAAMQGTLAGWCIKFIYYMVPNSPLSSASLTVANTAEFGWQDDTDASKPEYTTEPFTCRTNYNQSVISKTGDLKDGNVMTYKILVNENGDDLTGGKTLTVDDQMSDNLELDYRSITVKYPLLSGSYLDDYSEFADFYEAEGIYYTEADARELWKNYEAARALESFTYDSDQKTVSFTIADNLPVEINYNARVTEYGDSVEVDNAAGIRGYSTFKSAANAKYKVSDTSGSGSSEIAYLTILKQDEDSKEALNGAVFALYGPNDETKNGTPSDASTPVTLPRQARRCIITQNLHPAIMMRIRMVFLF